MYRSTYSMHSLFRICNSSLYRSADTYVPHAIIRVKLVNTHCNLHMCYIHMLVHVDTCTHTCTCNIHCTYCTRCISVHNMLYGNVLLILTDASFTFSNLTSALDSLPDTRWKRFGRGVNVPESTLDKIQSQFHTVREKKRAVLRVYSTNHPQPTWEHVSDALYRMKAGEYHRVLDRLRSLFPTGEYLSVPQHSSHTLPLIQ